MHETYDGETLFSNHPATGPRLGIIGGGQLARMTTIAAQQLGCDVVVLENNRFSPAATFASHSIIGDWNTVEALLQLASQVDIVTLENEFVDVALIAELELAGHAVWPCSKTLALVQDKFTQKQALQSAGLPIPRMRATDERADLDAAIAEFGLPLVLKARRNAYDGKGNATIRHGSEADAAWERLGGHLGNPLYVEKFCKFTAELAVIITRGRNGGTAIYPVVETVQKNHICHLVRAPAAVSEAACKLASDIARRAIEAVGAVGSFGVEMFLTHDGGIVVNELAPRVHNSGHYTIEACECSQFENHVRAVLGLPLGSTRMTAPAAAMVNLLGAVHAPGRVDGLQDALAVPGAHVHLYGKAMSGVGRKMGHVTALGDSSAEAEQAAIKCASKIRFGTIS
ncbi:MAG: 5-(carboxyamino)imidazole ribonucleotide synthase [Verrucomicrobiota bacterium]